MKCGLLGRQLGHSFSPAIHSLLGDYDYALLEKEPDQVEDFLLHGDFVGLNVTMPYKKTVLAYLDKLTDTARKLGAVNTIIRRPDGSLLGHNTDYSGFTAMVQRSGLTVRGKKVLVLGSGGASNTAVAVLSEMGASVVVISRQGENNYQNLRRHADARIIVNATPVGMYPHCGLSPVDLSMFPRLEGVLDLIYNPACTRLLLDAQDRGLVTENGLYMLVAQAEESAACFTGRPRSRQRLEDVYAQIRRQTENLVLIGMPGCGKSTVGAALAQKLGRKFVDIDREIEIRTGRPIPSLLEQEGEDAFRQLESQTLEQWGQCSGLVIATGGGCVTRQGNLPLLRQNGRIIWLERDLSKLPTEGRPLSTDLSALYEKRRPLYAAFAQHCVGNNGSIRQTLEQIMEVIA